MYELGPVSAPTNFRQNHPSYIHHSSRPAVGMWCGAPANHWAPHTEVLCGVGRSKPLLAWIAVRARLSSKYGRRCRDYSTAGKNSRRRHAARGGTVCGYGSRRRRRSGRIIGSGTRSVLVSGVTNHRPQVENLTETFHKRWDIPD